MKTTQKQITEVVDKTVGTTSSPEIKKQCEENLTKILVNGESTKTALRFTPEMLEALYEYAQRLYLSGNYKEASPIFNMLVVLDRNVYKYMQASAACAHMQQDYRQALTYYIASTYLDLSNPLPSYHASDCLLKLNFPQDAIECLKTAIAQAADNPKYAKIKERALLTKNAIESALAVAEKK